MLRHFPEIVALRHHKACRVLLSCRELIPGTTSAELLQHLKEEFDVPLHPHFVQRILEMAITMYRKWNEKKGAVFQLAIPGLDTSPEVDMSHSTDALPPEPRTRVLSQLNSFVVI